MLRLSKNSIFFVKWIFAISGRILKNYVVKIYSRKILCPYYSFWSTFWGALYVLAFALKVPSCYPCYASKCVLIDARRPTCKCINGVRPIRSLFLNWFTTVIFLMPSKKWFHLLATPSLIEAINVLGIYFLKNHGATWSVTVHWFPAENFHRILGIHVIKAFSEDYLSCFGHKIELSFNYRNLFLLKKQKHYAQKFNCVRLYRALIWHSKTTLALKKFLFARTEFSEIYFCDWMGIK